ncbi:MAG: preprotein translocase subunit YajC [Deltaproteobacteria bacterium RIFCSPLOWO2_01_44_7]|nr:MAG: preprotein translocase subunit YajC [Deltaproteobacteria bacterium RIFCSPHIGHO2_01_FULL_43_49]OGQ14691.1 MAG: preprotein translocase subunit YajC [Deltaproteobacteria bacterium RIFCSPHIGHO2_02_FULL_44_53]OGQ28077.1 MAG: preprotein translocase subunit YajC [Deltaproteobacteria bacterium RIFCSPHIGHO2_12_FULL_44_21]OGQ31289.1 MAG: preprotein translocase subunit YajC [Deltaproteobacteria bacterium RIFCSPLOWO2_01_FULL_45_74]OGQ41279.1 MAG: preprotein translocase subunit YajC [Deltaproteobact
MIHAMMAMAGSPQGQGGAQGPMNLLSTFAPLIIIFVIFYFLLIRPQQKQQKKTKEMLTSMRKGDSVITRAGIYGKITGIADNILTVEIAQNVHVKMTRDAIAQVTPSQE